MGLFRVNGPCYIFRSLFTLDNGGEKEAVFGITFTMHYISREDWVLSESSWLNSYSRAPRASCHTLTCQLGGHRATECNKRSRIKRGLS